MWLVQKRERDGFETQDATKLKNGRGKTGKWNVIVTDKVNEEISRVRKGNIKK